MLSVGNIQTKAAAKLGINRNTLHKKLKEHGLDDEPSSE
jgi:DNA-binding protein Fis